MVLAKTIRQQILHHLDLSFKRSPRINAHALSTIWRAAFNSIFNWTEDIWSMYSWASLEIFSKYLRLKGCRSENVILFPFNKCSFHYSIICGPIIFFKQSWNTLYINITTFSKYFWDIKKKDSVNPNLIWGFVKRTRNNRAGMKAVYCKVFHF